MIIDIPRRTTSTTSGAPLLEPVNRHFTSGPLESPEESPERRWEVPPFEPCSFCTGLEEREDSKFFDSWLPGSSARQILQMFRVLPPTVNCGACLDGFRVNSSFWFCHVAAYSLLINLFRHIDGSISDQLCTGCRWHIIIIVIIRVVISPVTSLVQEICTCYSYCPHYPHTYVWLNLPWRFVFFFHRLSSLQRLI